LICEHLQQKEDIAVHAKKNNASVLKVFSAMELGITEQSRRMIKKFCLTTKQFFDIFTRKE